MRKLIDPFEHYNITANRMGGSGILLMTGKGNPMTIGWAQMGVVWKKPVFTVLVRPSRYSYGLLEDLSEFSVNVLPEDQKKVLSFCGTKSGRDMDKAAECGLDLIPGVDISVPSCEISELIYECRVVAKQDLPPEGLLDEGPKAAYPNGDYHTFYYGQVLGVYKKN